MSKIAQSIAARVQQIAGVEAPAAAVDGTAAEASDGAAASASEATSDALAAPPPAGEPSGAASGAEERGADVADEAATKHRLLEEKLREVRERRQAQRLGERAKREKEAAEADRAAAAEERKKLEALKTGSFKDALIAMGRDPLATFEEMAAEAKEAGTPEGQIKAMRAQFEREMRATIEPLQKQIEELKSRDEAARRELEAQRAAAVDAQFQSDFVRALREPEFSPLLVEYEPETLLQVAQSLRDKPEQLFGHARRLGVRLTGSQGQFTMLDILRTIAAHQSEHEKAREARRARYQTANPGTQQTVNGTSARTNAATSATSALGNNAASSRSTDASKPRLTRRERVQRLIDRG